MFQIRREQQHDGSNGVWYSSVPSQIAISTRQRVPSQITEACPSTYIVGFSIHNNRVNWAGAAVWDSTVGSQCQHGVTPRFIAYTEKLDFAIILRADWKKRNGWTMGRGKGYKEITEKEKRAVLGALLAAEDHGVLPYGTYATFTEL